MKGRDTAGDPLGAEEVDEFAEYLYRIRTWAETRTFVERIAKAAAERARVRGRDHCMGDSRKPVEVRHARRWPAVSCGAGTWKAYKPPSVVAAGRGEET